MKKFLSCLWVLALLIATSCCAVADELETITSGDWSYRVLADGTAQITEYSNQTATSVQIPETLNGMKVTDVAENAFLHCWNNSSFVVSPDHPTLAVIDGVLFSKPDKRLISYPMAKEGDTYAIPQGIEVIEEFAFFSCTSLTSISIPNSVTSIGESAFHSCSSLASISIPESVTSIGTWAFFDCSSLTSISIPDNVTSIGDCAFFNCSSLTSISIPNSVTSIGDVAFSNCSSLTSIFIPNSVTSIGFNPFYGCEKITIELSSDHPVFSFIDGMLFSKPDKRLISYPRAKEGSTCTIPQGIEIIGCEAFIYCSSLTSITIPNSVTSIENGAFDHCRSLTSISIPDSVTSIGVGAFADCSSLTSISIPDTVTNIGFMTFIRCSSLTDIFIPDSVTNIGKQAFDECPNLTLTVGRNSYAEQYAKENNIPYAYPDANDWLTK